MEKCRARLGGATLVCGLPEFRSQKRSLELAMIFAGKMWLEYMASAKERMHFHFFAGILLKRCGADVGSVLDLGR